MLQCSTRACLATDTARGPAWKISTETVTGPPGHRRLWQVSGKRKRHGTAGTRDTDEKGMSMFPFADNWMSPQARENPFLALVPGMEPLQKTAETFMRAMGTPDMPRIPEVPFPALVPGIGALEADMEAMMKAVPGLGGLPNLSVHPMGAMAAAAAVSMGVASQVMGTMFGTATGMMDAAVRMHKATRDASPFAPPGAGVTSPLKFEWAFAAGEDAATPAAPAVKAAPVAKPVAGTGRAKARQAGIGAPTAGRKANGTAAASAEPVAAIVPARPGGPAAASEVMPEDFRQPRRMEKPAKPDDLKRISGVGPKLESVLNGLGIWEFTQIAAWTAEEIAWVDDYLQFKGRIVRDDWIDQAAGLAGGRN